MKKNLIALAILAASGVASAQSSVNLYGIADVWFGSVKAGGVRDTLVQSGGVDASRWGLKGTEDLGGGLKASFVLEQGFSIDNGAGGVLTNVFGAPVAGTTAAFSRQANLGLSGSFGEVKIGKVYTAYDDIADATYSSFSSDALAAPAYVFGSSAVYAYIASPNNTIAYYTPKFNGFSGAVSYSLGENKTAAVKASSVTALNAQYANGPIYVGFAVQNEKPQAGTSTKYALLNGSYDFGVAKLLADYAQVKNGAFKSRDFHIGADVPLASNIVLSGGYARSEDKLGGAKFAERSGYSLAVAYVLSKRTTAYAGLNNTKWENGAGVETNKIQAYAIGVKHAF